jgi:hypothetical protein
MSLFDNKYLKLLNLAYKNNTITRLILNDKSVSDIDDIQYLMDNGISSEDIIMSFIMSSDLQDQELVDKVNEIAKMTDYRSSSQMDLYEINQLYDGWLKDAGNIQIREKHELEKSELTIKTLSSIDISKISVGPYSIKQFEKEFHPTFNGDYVKPYHGFEIFSAVTCTRNLYFLQYCDPFGKVYTKIYTGDNIINSVNYKDIIIGTNTLSPNTIYFRLFQGHDHDNILYMTKKQIIEVYYNLDTNTLPLKTNDITSNEEQIIKYQLYKAIPGLEFNDLDKDFTKISGTFNIYDIDINYLDFTSFVQLNQVVSNLLYFDESGKIELLKKESYYNLLFKELASSYFEDTYTPSSHIKTHFDAKLKFKTGILNFKETLKLQDGSKKTYKQGTKILEIGFDGVLQNNILRLITILRQIIAYYLSERNNIRSFIHQYIPNILFDYDEEKQDKKIVVKKLDILKAFNDELFDTHFSTTCQLGRQPLPTHELDSIPDGVSYVEYPINSGDYYYCEDHYEKLYPGLSKNNNQSGKYSYYPCCFKHDQYEDKNSKLNEYLKHGDNDVQIDNKIAKLKSGELSHPISKKILTLFNSQFELGSTLRRMGVALTNNDIIHALCVATKHEEYNKSTNKNLYVDELQLSIASAINHEVVKQELYDLNYDDISKFLNNTNVSYNSELIYRILEEYFQVNIFVFSEIAPKTNTTRISNSEETVEFEIPRHKEFNLKYFDPNRECVMLYKSWIYFPKGRLNRPHYEPIVLDNKGEYTMVFSSEFSNYINDLYVQSNQNYLYDNKFNCYLGLLDNINIDYIVNGISQYIDVNGKTRIINALHYNIPVSIYLPPSAPVNLPASNEIYKIDYKILPQIMKVEPTLLDIKSGILYGAFFKIHDLEHGVYIPIKMINVENIEKNFYPKLSREDNLIYNEVASNNYITDIKSDDSVGSYNIVLNNTMTLRYFTLKNVWSVLRQIIIWLFTIHIYKSDRNVDYIQTFMENYFMVDERYEDSVLYYKMYLSNPLPIIRNVEAGMEYLKDFKCIKDGKFNLSSIELYELIKETLEQYIMTTIEYKIPQIIVYQYDYHENFLAKKETKVFVSKTSFSNWLNNIATHSNLMLNNIDLKARNSGIHTFTDPFLYYDELTNRTLLIQNTKDASLNEDINIFVINDNNKIELAKKGESNINILVYSVENVTYYATISYLD